MSQPSLQLAADPLRAALAAAIEAKASADRAAEVGRAAVARATRLAGEADAALEKATAIVDRARERQADAAADAAITGASPPPASVIHTARAAETEARDALEAAQTALARVRARLPELEEAGRHAGNQLHAAVNAILAPVAVRILAEAERLKSQYISTITLLRFLRCPEDFSNPNSHREITRDVKEREAPLADIAEASNNFLSRCFDRGALDGWKRDPALDPWREFRDRLMSDADAIMPT